LPPRCWIDERAFEAMHTEAARWRLRETGGALLGWRSGDDAVVAQALGPGPDAKHGLSSFEPDGPWQTAEGQRIYKETERCVAYIGDWHTHPIGPPRPSFQDRKAARLIADDDGFRAPNPLSAIFGWSIEGRRFSVFLWKGASFELMDLEACLIEDIYAGNQGRPDKPRDKASKSANSPGKTE
jgi:integrative and conjugative element protein (TIGR02256 family)